MPQNARAGLLDDLTIHAQQPVDSKAGFLLAAHLWLPDTVLHAHGETSREIYDRPRVITQSSVWPCTIGVGGFLHGYHDAASGWFTAIKGKTPPTFVCVNLREVLQVGAGEPSLSQAAGPPHQRHALPKPVPQGQHRTWPVRVL